MSLHTQRFVEFTQIRAPLYTALTFEVCNILITRSCLLYQTCRSHHCVRTFHPRSFHFIYCRHIFIRWRYVLIFFFLSHSSPTTTVQYCGYRQPHSWRKHEWMPSLWRFSLSSRLLLQIMAGIISQHSDLETWIRKELSAYTLRNRIACLCLTYDALE